MVMASDDISGPDGARGLRLGDASRRSGISTDFGPWRTAPRTHPKALFLWCSPKMATSPSLLISHSDVVSTAGSRLSGRASISCALRELRMIETAHFSRVVPDLHRDDGGREAHYTPRWVGTTEHVGAQKGKPGTSVFVGLCGHV